MSRPDILVVGAGVTGLTTAVHLAELGHAVAVAAAEPPAATTSAVAGAVAAGPAFADPAEASGRWRPFDAAVAWHRATLTVLERLASDPDSGVRVAAGRMVTRRDPGRPPAERGLPGFRSCGPDEAAGFPVAFRMSVPLIDMPRYLDHLARRLAAAGGTLAIDRLASLEEAAARAPVVVNCAGTGARDLAGDPAVFPVRGQHVVVANPGLTEFFFEFNPGPASTSLIPHGDRLILGGTAQPGQWSRRPDPAQTEAILRRCAEVEPRVARVPVLDVEVGLRVGRDRIRVEAEPAGTARIIHNYGHGSVAVSLSWGCAAAVAALIDGSSTAAAGATRAEGGTP